MVYGILAVLYPEPRRWLPNVWSNAAFQLGSPCPIFGRHLPKFGRSLFVIRRVGIPGANPSQFDQIIIGLHGDLHWHATIRIVTARAVMTDTVWRVAK